MGGAILIAADVPHPSNLTYEGRRILWTCVGIGIAFIVMFRVDRLQKHSAKRHHRRLPARPRRGERSGRRL